MSGQGSQIRLIEQQMDLRTTDRLLGKYFTMLTRSVPKGLGERAHGFKLNDQSFFDETFETKDSQDLKYSVEKLIEKMEIVASNTLKNKKFKVKAEERLAKLEAE